MTQSVDAGRAKTALGEALLADGVLTQDQLERALRVQKYLEQPRQLGTVLIELGYATRQEIADALKKHGGGMRIGDMLLEQGLITPDGLKQALELQKEKKVRLGKALIEIGAINERTLLQNLAHQAGAAYIEPDFSMIDRSLLTGVSPDYLAQNGFIPFSRNEDGMVTIVVSELGDDEVLQAVQDLYHEQFVLALGPSDAVKQAIEDFRRFRTEQPQDTRTVAGGDDAVIQLVDHILRSAVAERASDIHLEPTSSVVRVRYRIDGVLVYKTDLPGELLAKIISRIKILAECNIAEHQRHQGGRILYSMDGKEYDLRLSVYVTVHGESVVLRILSKQTGLVPLDSLGFNPAMLARLRNEVLDPPTGVALVTGPTGSGKTTTLYSSLSYNNSKDIKIITAEDPVEYMIDGIVQCSVQEKIGRTFESTLREIVRQDPDIIVLGEIRDHDTAVTAIQAALTGHKVYSTFHTEDTIGALLRLLNMNIEPFLIASTLTGVVAQRLLRRICEGCAAPYTPSGVELDRLGLKAAELSNFDLMRGRGCSECSYTGYYGRVGAYELLAPNDDVREAVLQRQSAHAIRKTCIESTGLISMREDAIAKVLRGKTTFEEVLRHTPASYSNRSLRQVLSMTQ